MKCTFVLLEIVNKIESEKFRVLFKTGQMSMKKIELTSGDVAHHIYAPFEEGGAYCVAHVGRSVGRSVGMSVSLNLVQLITQERFAPEAPNLVGR